MNDRHKHHDVEMIDFTYALINYSSKVASTGQDHSYLLMDGEAYSAGVKDFAFPQIL